MSVYKYAETIECFKKWLTFTKICVESVQIRSYFWSVFFCIWSEHGDLHSESPYSVRIQETMDQK